MASSSRIEIENLMARISTWIKYPLVDREQWTTVCPGTHPIGMSMEEWEKLEIKSRSMIQLYLVDSVLLNVSGEDSDKKL